MEKRIKKSKKRVVLFGIFVVILAIVLFYPYPLQPWVSHSDTYLQAYKLVKMRTLIGKTYDECYDILQDHGINMKTEVIKYNEPAEFMGKTEIIYATIIYIMLRV